MNVTSEMCNVRSSVVNLKKNENENKNKNERNLLCRSRTYERTNARTNARTHVRAMRIASSHRRISGVPKRKTAREERESVAQSCQQLKMVFDRIQRTDTFRELCPIRK